ncbi:metal ABC transporter substrate-binding protein [Actinomycetaceae bacterium TAE3-ERU4]|nr:metal ABC transporter substrate-binding protein [Actinomycetaceae bacterium TAE3-ERU4]
MTIKKNNVKRFCIALAAVSLFSLSACTAGAGSNKASGTPEITPVTSTDKKPIVLTTFTVLADIARNVSGDHLDIQSITKPGAEIHAYEPTPSDVKRATNANLIIDHGMGLELWFQKFIQDAKVPHVVLSQGIEEIPIEGSSHANPHTWMSPDNVQKYVDTLQKAFSKLDPAHAADYKANAEAYKAKLAQLQESFKKELSKLPPEQRVLTTCEGAFSYMAKDAGLQEVYLWPVNAESEVTAQSISKVIDTIKKKKVPAVFCESTVNQKAMRQVATSTGAKFGGVLYVDSLSEKTGPVPTYLDLIRYDSETISKALTGK